jgi:hypothetical protein
MKHTTYEHAVRNGKPVVVRTPRGSAAEPMTIRENVIGVAAGAALRRILRQH